MAEWQHYTDGVPQHTVSGELLVHRALHSPQLNNSRDVLVWLPASYHSRERRYPVLYMHDGQNLFDAHTSFAGEWAIDETMQRLAQEGYEAIIVGLPNLEERRFVEYSPYLATSARFPAMNGQGDSYLRFITDTVKPLIDADFRTLPMRELTGIAGSSLGGLISLYGFLTRSDVFGLCGAFSPAYWVSGRSLLRTAAERADGHGRVYLDVGTKEGGHFGAMPADHKPQTGSEPRTEYYLGVRQLAEILLSKGYKANHDLLYVEEADAEHNEQAWARRLPTALRFLLPRFEVSP